MIYSLTFHSYSRTYTQQIGSKIQDLFENFCYCLQGNNLQFKIYLSENRLTRTGIYFVKKAKKVLTNLGKVVLIL